ncbi:MAG TPA: aminoacyl-tRNA hydrolase [Candidatus Udaeobacter sp.]|nr:aminoacyl-tRNA hydrolase [Candidatus Udaeobacter sp.]
MPLLVGLGNPGARYARTRHNVGWRLLEMLEGRWKAAGGEEAGTYRTKHAVVGDREVDLMWPETWMNLSGEALRSWRTRHELDPAGLLVISDDVYLPVGELRVRRHGSSGGHRGLESIEAALMTRDYARLRIGVGSVESAELRDHVLEMFDANEETIIAETIARAADAAECWVTEGVIAAMNRFNRKVPKEAEES